MHFYEKRMTIKVALLIEFLKMVFPKIGPAMYFLGLTGPKPNFLVETSDSDSDFRFGIYGKIYVRKSIFYI